MEDKRESTGRSRSSVPTSRAVLLNAQRASPSRARRTTQDSGEGHPPKCLLPSASPFRSALPSPLALLGVAVGQEQDSLA